MPEGDVVYRTCSRLHQALAGREVTRSEFFWPSLAGIDLAGRVVVGSVARGKNILIRFDGSTPVTLHSHLRMEGSWRLDATTSTRPVSSVRAVIHTDTWRATGRKLGMLNLVATAYEDKLVGHLGPDVLGPDWDARQVAANIAAQGPRTIGEVLLDQRVMAGVGTFYMTEGLFLHGVTPWTPADEVSNIPGLLSRMYRMLWANTERAVQSTTGSTHGGDESYVHGRNNKPCRRCGTLIKLRDLGADHTARVAYFCPTCQRGPAPAHRRFASSMPKHRGR